MKRSGLLMGAAVILAVVALVPVQADAPPASGLVVNVYDGDTITIDAGGKKQTVRLLGIDCPEINYNQLWGEWEKVSKYAPLQGQRELAEARAIMRRWVEGCERNARRAQEMLEGLLEGKRVSLAYDRPSNRRDRYGRLLAYVSLDGVDLNAEMLRSGLAVADTRFTCERLGGYVKLWRGAQVKGAGMWTRTGRARAESAAGLSPSTTRARPALSSRPATSPRAGAPARTWVGSRGSNKYHYTSCSAARRISAVNLRRFASVAEARAADYVPCKLCRPPSR